MSKLKRFTIKLNINVSMHNFWLETNQIWGEINTDIKFNHARKILMQDGTDIFDCKQNIHSSNIDFGFRREHRGITLRKYIQDMYLGVQIEY